MVALVLLFKPFDEMEKLWKQNPKILVFLAFIDDPPLPYRSHYRRRMFIADLNITSF
jgi:hypothetical protein